MWKESAFSLSHRKIDLLSCEVGGIRRLQAFSNQHSHISDVIALSLGLGTCKSLNQVLEATSKAVLEANAGLQLGVQELRPIDLFICSACLYMIEVIDNFTNFHLTLMFCANPTCPAYLLCSLGLDSCRVKDILTSWLTVWAAK